MFKQIKMMLVNINKFNTIKDDVDNIFSFQIIHGLTMETTVILLV